MKNVDKYIKIISVTMAVVLVMGVVFSLVKPSGTILSVNNPVTDYIPQQEFSSIIDTTKPEDYDTMLDTIVKLRSEYSDMLKIYTMGYSACNRAIPMITMGSGDKKAFIVCAVHAREHLTTKYILRCIEDYCYAVENGDGKIGDFDVRTLLTQYTLYIVPCTNPDGLEIVLSNQEIKKGVSVDNLEDYKANYNGVDLNRQYPLEWEAVDNGVYKPSGYFFKGYMPGSENESKALMRLCDENDFLFMLSVHVKGNCIYWGDNHNTEFNHIYRAFATDISNATGFTLLEPTPTVQGYGGGFENWFRHTYERPGLCVELVENKYTTNPCTNENYEDFDTIVNYDNTKYMIAAAMQSVNNGRLL